MHNCSSFLLKYFLIINHIGKLNKSNIDSKIGNDIVGDTEQTDVRFKKAIIQKMKPMIYVRQYMLDSLVAKR